MKRTHLIAAWSRQIVVLTTLFLSSAAAAAYAVSHGISMRWHDGAHALVIGTLRLDRPVDLKAQIPAQYSFEVDSVVFGELEPGVTIPLRHAFAVGLPPRSYRLPVGDKALFLLNRPAPAWENYDGPIWAISGGPYDFMGPEGVPFCRLGPEADAILRDVPRMIEIAGLGRGDTAGRTELKHEAVWEEWRKGDMRRSLVLGWILYLGLNEPKHKEETLNFLADLVNDRTMPPECRLIADAHLASPLYNRPDYANNTPARTALLIELLAHPELPEHTREQAERTLADLSRRLEADKAAASPGPQPE